MCVCVNAVCLSDRVLQVKLVHEGREVQRYVASTQQQEASLWAAAWLLIGVSAGPSWGSWSQRSHRETRTQGTAAPSGCVIRWSWSRDTMTHLCPAEIKTACVCFRALRAAMVLQAPQEREWVFKSPVYNPTKITVCLYFYYCALDATLPDYTVFFSWFLNYCTKNASFFRRKQNWIPFVFFDDELPNNHVFSDFPDGASVMDVVKVCGAPSLLIKSPLEWFSWDYCPWTTAQL